MSPRKTTAPAKTEPLPAFATRLLAWHAGNGRHDLPWQHPRSPYRVWLSEIMLQQTQVTTVIGYFQRFVEALPTLPDLAAASADQVMALWSGLGYYSRARNLHKAAQICVTQHGGELPRDLDALIALPGIGRSTAGAILAQAHGSRAAILDGNVKRVLCRSHGIHGFPGERAIEQRLWQLADALLPSRQLADYTQAVMDLGATVCTRARPSCPTCPLRNDCLAFATDSVSELPTPKPRKTLPQRQATWLLLIDDDRRVLLHKRPAPGIWGGLWSLPEYPDDTALRSDLALRLGRRQRGDPEPLAPVRHVFSHYALTAQPFRLRISQAAGIADHDDERWQRLDELAKIGLPQPIRRLLADQHHHDD